MNQDPRSQIGAQEPGAKWLRCDLHVHTPFDGEKKFGENLKHAIEAFKKQDTTKLAEIASRFVDACTRAAEGQGIDLVAITDHNSIAGYKRLKPLFESLRQQAPDRDLSMPAIVPGVEFSVGGERPLHFLVIFSSATRVEEIEGAIAHVFGSAEPFDQTKGTPKATGQSVDSFLKNLHDWCRPSSGDRSLSYIILPAHADSRRGIGRETGGLYGAVSTTIWDEMKGHLRRWVVTREDWNGFQTANPFKDLPEEFQNLLARWIVARRGGDWDDLDITQKDRIRRRRHWPLVEASDPHTYEAIGTRYTWLKMEVPDVEGIRLALLDPASRLRRMSEGRPGFGYPIVRNISINGTDFFETVSIDLNPCLNTLIGGRGSGKSTVVECLRYVLDRNRQMDFERDEKEILDSVNGFLQSKEARDYGETKGILLPEHQITTEIQISGQVYQISRGETGIRVTRDGAEVPLDVRTLIAPRILSQGQIARIARDSSAQRRELDNLPGPDWARRFVEQRRDVLARLEELQTERRVLQDKASTLLELETFLQRVEDQIAFLERGTNKEVLEHYKSLETESNWLKQAFRIIEDARDRLTETGQGFQELLIKLGMPADGPSRELVAVVAERVSTELTRIQNELSNLAKSLEDVERLLRTDIDEKWNPGYVDAKKAYEQLQENIKQQGIEFAQHGELLVQRTQLQQSVASLKQLEHRKGRVEAEIQSEISALVGMHETRLEERRRLASSLEHKDSDVRVEVILFGDRSSLASQSDEWFGGSGLRDQDWDQIVEYIYSDSGSVPRRIAEVVRAMRIDLEAAKNQSKTIRLEESAVAKLLGSRSLTRHFCNAVQKFDPEKIDAFERFLPEDRVEARVRDAQGLFKPIEQGSIGLKSTAVLSLLLSGGEQPLIIDQPESDLDNQYVYNVVVDLLRKRKFSRQIIIATHNANIPVNGDAEVIVALGAENRLGVVKDSGSIDRPEIKHIVSEVMEGSAEAFRLRRERYGY
jgi:predicted ATP-dependent endonuclease of OLD family